MLPPRGKSIAYIQAPNLVFATTSRLAVTVGLMMEPRLGTVAETCALIAVAAVVLVAIAVVLTIVEVGEGVGAKGAPDAVLAMINP